MVGALIRSGGLRRAQESERALGVFIEETHGSGAFIPDSYWSVRPAPRGCQRKVSPYS